MTDFRLDWDRPARTGISEAVLCEAKSPEQIDAIAQHAVGLGRRLLFTRLSAKKFSRLEVSVRERLDFDAQSRTAVLGELPDPHPGARVAIVAAGTSDLPVAREAERTLRFAGERPTFVADVGVAGLWRLMEHVETLREHRVVIAVAGMEGALFSVLAGLVPAVVVAVPTSVGYGVGKGGRTALHSALASCASGLAVVNIDNGFGAAHAALRVLAAASSR